jgi:hypothetical protein
MGKKYLAEKKKKKKSAMNGVAVLVVLALIFIFIVAKFALSGGGVDDAFSGAPTGDDVYAIAKSYVKPTLRSSDATFSDSQYQFGKKEDSVYVIRSHVDVAGGQGTNFEITLKYKGGAKNDERNWEVLNLNEE